MLMKEQLQKLSTYSTEEQRIGTWNGKPMYRKVVYFNPSSANMRTWVTHNINDVYEMIPTCSCMLNRVNGSFFPVSLVYPYDTTQLLGFGTGWQVSKTGIELWLGTEIRQQLDTTTYGYGAKAILEYTKTTD